MNRLLLMIVAVAVIVLALVAAGNVGVGPVVITREDEQKIILLLSDPRKVTEPGWALRIPFLEEVQTYDRRLLLLNTDPLPIQTRDEERIVVDNYVVWRITDPVLFRQSFPGGTLKAESRIDRAVRNDVREVVGQHTLTEVLKDQRVEIMRTITEKMDQGLTAYGIRVVDVRINRTELPAGTESNVYARMKANRDRLARKHRAEGDEKARRIRAEADREARVIIANANRDAEIARGIGDAEATRIYAEAYGDDVEFYTFMRSLEAYRATINEKTTIVLSPNAEFFRFFQGSRPAGRR